MIEKLKVQVKEETLTLISDITYSHAVYWFDNTMKPLKMSVVMPKDRTHPKPHPLLVWLCGGGFSVMDKDVWIPQLIYFAKKGYVVASVEYRTTNESRFPDPVVDIKAAIRYLRAHADDFFIDPDRIVLGGESAGACLSLLAAATDGNRFFERGDYLNYSSSVQAILDFYGTVRLDHQRTYGGEGFVTESAGVKFGNAETMLSSKMPPVFIAHGDKDQFVNIEDSYFLHDRLQELNVPCDFFLLEGASHGVDEFYQPEMFDRALAFLDKNMPTKK